MSAQTDIEKAVYAAKFFIESKKEDTIFKEVLTQLVQYYDDTHGFEPAKDDVVHQEYTFKEGFRGSKERQMTLEEYIGQLDELHLARLQYNSLKAVELKYYEYKVNS